MDDVLIDAQVLAEFANLNAEDGDPLSPTNIDHFRHNHPGFVPEQWWTDTVVESPNRPPRPWWEFAVEDVQEAWKGKFPLEACVNLIVFGTMFPIKGQGLPKSKISPYQQAVMFLGTNRWRAKFCLRCGNRFVATTPKSIYCSDACFQLARKDSKKAWWTEHGQQWRNSKKTKASSKSKRSK